MKIFGFLFIIFGWADLDHEFSWTALSFLVLGIIIMLGEEILSHFVYLYKNERLKIDRK